MRERAVFLDGLRGWGALVVLAYHLFIDGFPANDFMADKSFWWHVLFLNGGFAVNVFFIVSGFALSIGYFQNPDWRDVARLAAGRYFRLAVPILLTCLAVYVLMKLGAIMPAPQRPYLQAWLRFEPDLSHALLFGLIDVFFRYSHSEALAPPLWTMSYELFGSFLVFALILIPCSYRMRLGLYAFLTIALLAAQSYYATFIFGALLAAIHAERQSAPPVVIAGALIGLAGFLLLPYELIQLGMLGCAMCFSVCAIFSLRSFFETPLSAWLGTISFPLYLVHAPVMFAFTLWLVPVVGTFWACVITVPAALLVAWLFRFADEWGKIASRLFGLRRAAAVPYIAMKD